MRDILFKAKTCNGMWVSGLLARKDNKWFISNKVGSPFAYEIRPDTICQYTGLTDKNGKKIWENDVLCGHLDDMCPDYKTYAHVLWHKNGWYTKENGGIDYNLMDEFDEHFFAVVGNVFDNADLLK